MIFIRQIRTFQKIESHILKATCFILPIANTGWSLIDSIKPCHLLQPRNMCVMMSQINTKTRLVLQQFVQTNNKEKHKTTYHWSCGRPSHRWQMNCPHKGWIMRKTFFTSWRHHVSNSVAISDSNWQDRGLPKFHYKQTTTLDQCSFKR